MTEFNHEPVWVGMDAEAELARYAEEDRRCEQVETVAPPAPKRAQLRRGLRAAIPSLGRGGAPRFPLVA